MQLNSVRSTVKSPAGLLRWATARAKGFSRKNSQAFAIENDGEFHDYTLEFTTDSSLQALRFDLGRGEGELAIRRIVLRDSQGRLVRKYSTSEDGK